MSAGPSLARTAVRVSGRSTSRKSLKSVSTISIDASSHRFISSSACSSQSPNDGQAVSQSSSGDRSSVLAPTSGTTRSASRNPGESSEDAWKRNMQEVREWRRRRDSQRSKLPLFLPDSVKPPRPSPLQASLSTLLASGAALGHSTSSLSPAYLPYIYGNRSGLSIIDLDQTLPILRRTAGMIRDLVQADGVVLVVGTRKGHVRMLEKTRERLGDSVFVVEDWMPGTLTNSVTFFGLEPMTSRSHLPDVAIFLNPSENLGAIRECTAKNIPSVGIVDTDTDPRIVTYPIPANMESLRATELILSTLTIAGEEGRRLRNAADAERVRDEQSRSGRRGGRSYSGR